jgi:hypothetical protein
MSLYVVDASIAIKLHVPEVHSAQATHFFSDGHELSPASLHGYMEHSAVVVGLQEHKRMLIFQISNQ